MRSLRCLCFCLVGGLPALAAATTWHVDAAAGDDAAAGSEAAPWRTIMRACKVVEPGDTVLVHPGVYFEHVKLERSGTAAAPITFASVAGADRTSLTGAHPALRRGELAWTAVDGTAGLWRVPLAAEPATVLCDELNLYRYPSLAELRAFRVNDVAGQKLPGPGPRHGFAWAEGQLYLRLHPDGRDGDRDPGRHVIKASPPRGAGFRGDEIDSRLRANFGVVTGGPAHVVIQGFTCESPGFCGVWTRAGGVTVRDCRFLGCRTGVRGWDRSEKTPRQLSEDVTIEGCEFSEAPLYQDAADLIAEVCALPDAERQGLARFFWWHRKGGAYTSEIGLVTAAGRRWTIRNNDVHDVLDGLSFMSLSFAEDCLVEGNRFTRILDNAVEAENHAQRLRVVGNQVVDCFEPFSYQPLGGTPWPTDIVFERNVVSFTRAGAALWSRPNLGWSPGCVKIYVKPELTEVPEGLVFRANRIWFPTGGLLSVSRDATVLRGVRFEDNVVAALRLGGHESGDPAQHVVYQRNRMVFDEDPAALARQARELPELAGLPAE